MPDFRYGGMKYHYLEQGNGPLLVLLHGFTGSAASWGKLLPKLARDYHVLALDLPGHGASAAPPVPALYGMATVAAAVNAWLDSLGLDTAHLLGYSMGGRLALYLALHLPGRWRSLILESSSPGLATVAARQERRTRDAELARFIEREGMEAFVDFWEGIPLFASQQKLPPARRRQHRRQRLQNRPAGLANSLRGMGTGAQPSLWEQLPQLELPVLLLVGALDEKFAAIGRQMVGAIPRAQLEIVPRAGHTIHLEQPDVWLALVRRWLAADATGSFF